MRNKEIIYVKDPSTNLTKRVIKHGGKRTGAGRKPKEPTVVRRVPISVLARVDKLIAESKK